MRSSSNQHGLCQCLIRTLLSLSACVVLQRKPDVDQSGKRSQGEKGPRRRRQSILRLHFHLICKNSETLLAPSSSSAGSWLTSFPILSAAGAGLQDAVPGSNAGLKGKKTWLGSRGQAAPGRMQIVISSYPQQVMNLHALVIE